MSAYRPKTGDRIRVVIEGEVHGDRTGIHTWGIDSHGWNGANVVSVEKLPDPEPEYQQGDLVLSARGFVYARQYDGSWVEPGVPQPYAHDYPTRPLMLLVRNGRPVQP